MFVILFIISLDVLLFIIFIFIVGMLFASGLAATTTVTHLLNADDHVVAMDDIYGGMYAYAVTHSNTCARPHTHMHTHMHTHVRSHKHQGRRHSF